MLCAMCGMCLGMYTPILRRRRSPLVLATRSGSRVVQITLRTDRALQYDAPALTEPHKAVQKYGIYFPHI